MRNPVRTTRIGLAGLLLSLLAYGAADSGPAFAADPAAPPAATPPAAQEVISTGQATSILGRPVTGPDNEVVGRIIDLLVDNEGQPRAAVIDIGGFMGLGNRHIAVAWRSLRFTPYPAGPGDISLGMSMDQIAGTPEYRPSGLTVTVAAPPLPPPEAPP